MARRTDLDAVRAAAIVGVVAVHASAGQVLRGPDGGQASYVVALLFDAAGRCAVPLFFALAGWVLLAGKPVDSGRDLVQRAARIALALGVWTLVYAGWTPVWQGDGWAQAWKTVPLALAGVPAVPALWYLYAYLPLLLAVGAAWLVARRVPARLALVLLAAIMVLPATMALLAGALGVQAPAGRWGLPLYAVVYAVAGAAVFTRMPPLARRWRLLAGVGLAAWTVLMVVWAYRYGHAGVFGYETLAVAVQFCLAALAANGARVPTRLRPAVQSLAEASFGVYLVHMLVLQALLLGLARVSPALGGVQGWWSIPALTLATVAVSWGLSSAWGRLGWRRVLG